MEEPVSIGYKLIDSVASERRLALVVGVNNYRHREAGDYILTPLQYAEHDAEKMKELLTQVGFEVVSLIGAQATYDAVKTSFTDLARLTTTKSHLYGCFLFHFSGHGQIDPHNDETAYYFMIPIRVTQQ